MARRPGGLFGHAQAHDRQHAQARRGGHAVKAADDARHTPPLAVPNGAPRYDPVDDSPFRTSRRPRPPRAGPARHDTNDSTSASSHDPKPAPYLDAVDATARSTNSAHGEGPGAGYVTGTISHARPIGHGAEPVTPEPDPAPPASPGRSRRRPPGSRPTDVRDVPCGVTPFFGEIMTSAGRKRPTRSTEVRGLQRTPSAGAGAATSTAPSQGLHEPSLRRLA